MAHTRRVAGQKRLLNNHVNTVVDKNHYTRICVEDPNVDIYSITNRDLCFLFFCYRELKCFRDCIFNFF